MARVSRKDKYRKLMSTWTGPWRVANDDKEHVYGVQHLVTAELRDVHVARMRFAPMTSSRSPASSARFPTIGEPGRVPHPEHICYQAGCKRRRVRCQGGLGRTGGGCTWEPVSRVFHDAPAVLRKELKALRVKAEQKRALVQRYGLRL